MSLVIFIECLFHNNYYTLIRLEPSADTFWFCSSFSHLFKSSFISYNPNPIYYLNFILSQWLVHCLWILGVSLFVILFALHIN